MKYNITDTAITLSEDNKRRIINLSDEIMAPHEQSLISMILIEKKSYNEICTYVDDILNKVKAVTTTTELAKPIEETIETKLKTVNVTIEEIEDFTNGQITIQDNILKWRGEAVNNKKLINFVAHYKKVGADISFIERFMEKLYANPDQRARDDIFDFIVNRCGILADGDFIAYKRVKQNYKDCHTGTMDNSIGTTVFMDRSKCDSNPKVTCSRGLHVCTKGYLSSFGGDKVIICKVNPKDVVAIPSDYNAMKMRCCEYKVIGEIKNQNEFNDIIEKLYNDPTDMTWMNKDLRVDSASNVTKNVGLQGTIEVVVTDIISTLEDIFANDSKVLSSFKAGRNVIENQEHDNPHQKQMALENELLSRALKLRPGNAKLKVAVAEWEERRKNAKEVKENSQAVIAQVEQDAYKAYESNPSEVTQVQFDMVVKLNEIFCTDSNMLKSFAVASRNNNATEFESESIKQQALVEEMILRAQKLRPTNTKFKALLEEFEQFKHAQKIKDVVNQVYIEEEVCVPDIDVSVVNELINEFSTDSKVSKALEKVQEEEGKSLFDSMIEKIKKVRPDSAKLRRFLENLGK